MTITRYVLKNQNVKEKSDIKDVLAELVTNTENSFEEMYKLSGGRYNEKELKNFLLQYLNSYFNKKV
jgi:hypothetical protein